MNPIMPEEMKNLCETFYKQAKEGMMKIGSHEMLLFLVNDDQTVIVPNVMNMEKYDYCDVVSRLAGEMNSRAVICISEAYASMMDKDDKRANDPNFQPSKDPAAREALVVTVSDPYGGAASKMGFYKKVEDEIIFEEEDYLEEAIMSMVPPWKKGTIH